jgi:hypothetical protein
MTQAAAKNTGCDENTEQGRSDMTLATAWARYADGRPAFEAAVADYNALLAVGLLHGYFTSRDWLDSASNKQADFRRLECAAGLPTVEAANDAASRALDAIIESIAARSATSLRDLADLANVCATMRVDLWRTRAEALDWDQRPFRLLIEAVLKLAGEPLVLDGHPLPSPVEFGAIGAAVREGR